ncbi:MAG: hypothetical protein ACLTTY_03465 [Oscillospiraceae bacterium]
MVWLAACIWVSIFPFGKSLVHPNLSLTLPDDKKICNAFNKRKAGLVCQWQTGISSLKGLNYMASLIHEISTHAYNKAKYLKSPGKDESGNPAEVVRITKKANGSIRTTPSNSGIGARETTIAGTLMTASRTYRIMPIF